MRSSGNPVHLVFTTRWQSNLNLEKEISVTVGPSLNICQKKNNGNLWHVLVLEAQSKWSYAINFFSSVLFTMTKLVTEERLLELKETFSLYDKDMNGSISTEELSMVCYNLQIWAQNAIFGYFQIRRWRQWGESPAGWRWKTWSERRTLMATGPSSSQSLPPSWKSEWWPRPDICH